MPTLGQGNHLELVVVDENDRYLAGADASSRSINSAPRSASSDGNSPTATALVSKL